MVSSTSGRKSARPGDTRIKNFRAFTVRTAVSERQYASPATQLLGFSVTLFGR